MQPRTRNEKTLLAILAGIIFVGGNFYGYQWFSQKQAALDLTCGKLRADKAEAEVDLQKSAFWAQRKAWITAHEPVLGEEGDAKAQVLQEILKGARNHHLEILEQSLNEVEHGFAGARVTVSVKVKGSMEGLCEWLAELQKPAEFYAVPLFSLTADQDQKSMICTLHLTRYFREGS